MAPVFYSKDDLRQQTQAQGQTIDEAIVVHQAYVRVLRKAGERLSL